MESKLFKTGDIVRFDNFFKCRKDTVSTFLTDIMNKHRFQFKVTSVVNRQIIIESVLTGKQPTSCPTWGCDGFEKVK